MEAALAAGARIVNDVAALLWDERSLEVVAKAGCPVVLMHSARRAAKGSAWRHRLSRRGDRGVRLAGSADHWGRGGGSRPLAHSGRSRHRLRQGLQDNLRLLNNLTLFHGLGCPIVLGASRKRLIGALSNEAPADQRLGGSVALVLKGLEAGVQLLRVHDVAETVQAVRVWRGLRTRRWSGGDYLSVINGVQEAVMLVASLCWIVMVNAWTIERFRDDKRRAIAGARRIPEADLLTLALIGGSPGAFAGRHIFRHKTRKEPFSTYLMLIATMQVGAGGALLLFLNGSPYNVYPPSLTSTAPVIVAAASERRKAICAATLLGLGIATERGWRPRPSSQRRRRGRSRRCDRRTSAPAPTPGFRTPPGAIALTRMRRGAASFAATLVSWDQPPPWTRHRERCRAPPSVPRQTRSGRCCRPRPSPAAPAAQGQERAVEIDRQDSPPLHEL